jgi:hypothetical protein
MYFTIIIGIISIGAAGVLVARYRQKKAYNNGVCPYCDIELERYVSYNGNREYFCEECGYQAECSFNVELDHNIIRKILLFLLQVCFVIISPISFIIAALIFYIIEKQWQKFEWNWYKEIIGSINPY